MSPAAGVAGGARFGRLFPHACFEEFKTALHVQKLQAGDPRVAYAEAYAAAFLNNRTIVGETLGHGDWPH